MFDRLLNNLKVKVKLLGSFSIVIVLFLAVVTLMIFQLRSIASLNEQQSLRNQDVRFAFELKNEIDAMSNFQSDVILNEDSELASQYLDMVAKFRESITQAMALFADENEAAELKADSERYINTFGQLMQLHQVRKNMDQALLMQGFQTANQESNQYKDVIFARLDSLIGQKDAEFEAARERMNAGISQAVIVSVVVTVIAVLAALALSLFTGGKIAGPLIRLTSTAKQVARGDLTAQIRTDGSRDEIGELTQSFAEMVANLKALIRQVEDTAKEVAASSEQLSVSAEESERGSKSVADAIERMASGAETQEKVSQDSAVAMDEMAAGLQKIAESAANILDSSKTATDKANTGSDLIRQAMSKMSEIRSSADDQVRVVTELEDKSREINKIVAAITNIAKQTNLLSLNAAIEAARAGEHGKGFAVVADEVRQLAEQSRQSAEQIAGLIARIQEDIRKAVDAIKEGNDEVHAGMSTVEQSGEAFAAIQEAVNVVTQQIQEMSALTEQMSAGSEEVAASVAEIAGIAKETSRYAQDMSAASEEQMAIVQQISASASHLSSRAMTLQEMINRFKV